jgi:hypothetical protein
VNEPVDIQAAASDTAKEILFFLEHAIGARRDRMGRIGQYCKYIRPALRAGGLLYVEQPEISASDDSGAVDELIRRGASHLLAITDDERTSALVLSLPGSSGAADIESLWSRRGKSLEVLYDRGMTGALCYRQAGAIQTGERVDRLPASPFWVLRFLIREDAELVGHDARAKAAYARKFVMPAVE